MTAIVFDFGGVLFRWQPAQLVREVLPARAHDETLAAQVFQSWGGDWAEFDRGRLEVPELVARTARRTGLPAAEVQALVEAVPGHLAPIDGSVRLVGRLKAAGVPLFYLSNMPRSTGDGLLARHGFLSDFADGVFSGHVGHNKPEREIFEIASARFGRAPGELLFIDDHAPNIDAARALGWQGFVFESPAGAEQQLRERGLL